MFVYCISSYKSKMIKTANSRVQYRSVSDGFFRYQKYFPWRNLIQEAIFLWLI